MHIIITRDIYLYTYLGILDTVYQSFISFRYSIVLTQIGFSSLERYLRDMVRFRMVHEILRS